YSLSSTCRYAGATSFACIHYAHSDLGSQHCSGYPCATTRGLRCNVTVWGAIGKVANGVMMEKQHEYRTEQSASLRLCDCRLRRRWWSSGWESGEGGSEGALA